MRTGQLRITGGDTGGNAGGGEPGSPAARTAASMRGAPTQPTELNNAPSLSFNPIQHVQSTAATKYQEGEHITPILAHLHWLPVKFKDGFAPSYITDLLTPHLGHSGHHLNTSSPFPRTRLKSKGLSLSLPLGSGTNLLLQFRSSPTFASFKSKLKPHLFTLAFTPS